MISVSKLILHSDDCIRFEAVRDKPGAPVVIFSSGFLSENDDEWSSFVTKELPEYQLLRVRWKSSSFRELVKILGQGVGYGLVSKSLLRDLSAFTTLTRVLNPWKAPAAAFSTLRSMLLAKRALNLWSDARNEAELAGKHLAKALNAASIYRNPNDELVPTILLGHSLGARLMVSCLEESYRKIVQRAVLLGGAVDAEGDVITKICNKTVYPTINCYSANDVVLKWIYRLGNLSLDGAIGRTAIGPAYDDINTTFQVAGHGEYCGNDAIGAIIRRGISSTSYTKTRPDAALNGFEGESAQAVE